MNIIVFSKDRPPQLELFIRSFKTYVKNADNHTIKVIYLATNEQYILGYNKLMAMNYPNIIYVKEERFYENVLQLIDPTDEHIVFFSDDNIFKNKYDFYDKQMDIFNRDKDIACISLRLHPRLTYCYPQNIPQTPPKFDENYIFYWRGLPGDYGYPMSVDGHIFRTKDIYPALKRGRYPNPTMLENYLVMNTLRAPKMICYDKSIIVNNPCNRASSCAGNIHGTIELSELNSYFLEGKLISLDNIDGIENISCHQEIQIQY